MKPVTKFASFLIISMLIFQSCGNNVGYNLNDIEGAYYASESHNTKRSKNKNYRILITHKSDNDFNIIQESSLKNSPNDYKQTDTVIGTYNPENHKFLVDMMGAEVYFELSDDYKSINVAGKSEKFTKK